MHPHLIQILTKWSSKIQAVAPSVLLPSNRGAFSNKSAHGLKSAVQLVDETLQGADYDKILAKTRVRRVKGLRIGKESEVDGTKKEDDVDVEIFDDTDFYQQLLRDVIDARGGGNGVEGADDWMVMQKQKKAKKKIDTKASKGRKLRYALVHILFYLPHSK
jgi:protein AATF/BFR2